MPVNKKWHDDQLERRSKLEGKGHDLMTSFTVGGGGELTVYYL
jgi:hypothetical protein